MLFVLRIVLLVTEDVNPNLLSSIFLRLNIRIDYGLRIPPFLVNFYPYFYYSINEDSC